MAAAIRARAKTRAPAAGGRRCRAELPPEEESWLRAVALTLAGATALSLYAVLSSVTPRVVAESDALPFIVFGARKMPGGGVYTHARFETFPILCAALSWALALAAYGLLRRHWRRAGLERIWPDRPLVGASQVLVLGLLLDAMALLRFVLERAGVTTLDSYIPVAGGVLELLMVYLVWYFVLEAFRTARALWREPRLWLGVALALIPPVTAFSRVLFSASPSP